MIIKTVNSTSFFIQDEHEPFGNTFVHGNGTFQYRWINPDTPNEQFQVKYCRKWVDAQSIDFDFIN